jgi:outer membrane immunogenic protein
MTMISRFVLCTVALVGCAASASAADLGSLKKSPPPPPAAFTWDGFYLGGQIGAGRAMDKLIETDPTSNQETGYGSLGERGIIGGAHAGYNWQFGSVVTGLEGDFEETSLRKNIHCEDEPGTGACYPATYSLRTALPWQGSARARLGYAFGNILVYGTAGAAIADVSTRYTTSFPRAFLNGSQSFDRTKAGATIGAGVEYAIDANWSVRAEYRFSDFGKISNAPTSAGVFWNGYSEHHSVEENAVLFGISYKFGAPAAAAR